MKKLFSLSVAALFALGAQAQVSQKTFDKVSDKTLSPYLVEPAVSLGSAAKTTAVPFWTEDFGSGTTTTLPTGWSVSGNGVSQTWKWNNVAEVSQFTSFLPTINSTTKTNGWMVYNSDTIGSLNPTVSTLTGTLTSPTFSCAGHSSVKISFQQFFRRLNDSCFLEVSGDNGATYTRFEIQPNNTIAANTSLTNPTLTGINVSSVAANQSQVRIRFVYFARAINTVGGGYLWSVDDVAASELDPVDLELSNAAFIMTLRGTAGVGFTSFSNYPRQLVDTVYPQLSVSNRGSTAIANTSFDASVTGPNGASVYNKSVIFTNIPVTTVDSVVEFETQPGFTPAVNGTYTGVFSTNPAGDANLLDNTDTARFTIGDTLMSRNEDIIRGAFDVHSPASGSEAERKFFIGTLMEIPAGKSDTVTGASVIFDRRTTSGTNATVQIYKFDGLVWNFVVNTQQLILTPSNISTSTTPRFTYFPMVIAPNDESRYILTGGADGTSYAVVVQGDNNPASSSVLVSSSDAIAFRNIGSSGVAYVSGNDGGADFGQGSTNILTTGPSTPFVRLHFSNYKPVSVKNIDGLVGAVNAYPNPSSTQLFVPVTLSKAADLSVTLSTPMGQVVARQDFGKVAAGQEMKATFNTAALANGIYFYTVEVAGERLTNRVVVSH